MKPLILVVMGFWLLYYICYVLETPIHGLLAQHITLRSEYTVGEQLSKFYLFIIVLVSIFSYRVSTEPSNIKLSISFLMLGLVLYMSESNMITERTQPLFGLMLLGIAATLLLQSRRWLSLALLITGFAVIANGVLSDLVHENDFLKSLVPAPALNLLYIATEERLDVIGIAFLCLCAIVCFRDLLWSFVAQNIGASFLILAASGMITVGNGFIHHGYGPGKMLHFLALVVTVGGFLGLILTNKRMSKNGAILTLVTEDLFYLFLFFFFVLLPSLHGPPKDATSLLLWLPALFLMARYLWRSHPKSTRRS